VDVIFHAIDEDGLAPDGLQGARHVGVQTGAEFRVFEKWAAVLRAEDNMQDDAGEGLWRSGAGLLRPVGALPIPYCQTQPCARSSPELGWLDCGPLALNATNEENASSSPTGCEAGHRSRSSSGPGTDATDRSRRLRNSPPRIAERKTYPH